MANGNFIFFRFLIIILRKTKEIRERGDNRIKSARITNVLNLLIGGTNGWYQSCTANLGTKVYKSNLKK